MRMLAFAKRNVKEVMRDPMTLLFGLALPVIMLVLFSFINSKVPDPSAVPLFAINMIAPAICVFSFSFISLFAGLIMTQDKSSAFILRLLSSPIRTHEILLGYALPLFVSAFVQVIVCYGTALIMGLKLTSDVFMSLLVMIPVVILYIAIGLLFGAIFNEKQVGGLFSVFVNVAAWFSGVWFSVEFGGAFEWIAKALPFYHAVELVRNAVNGIYDDLWIHIAFVLAYALVFFILAVFGFKKKVQQ